MYSYLLGVIFLSSPQMDGSLAVNCIANTYLQLPGDIMEVTYFYTDGKVKQKGYTINGEKTGTWTTFSPDGKITAKAYYENGEKEGKWKIYNEKGDLMFKIFYHENKKVWAQSYDESGKLKGFNYK